MVTFLVIRFSSIGDIVLTTPVIRGLKQQVENSRIIFITKSQFKDVVVLNPYIDKSYYLEDSLSKVIAEVKKEKIDFIIDLHKNLRSLRVKSKLNRTSFSFNKLNWAKWVRVNLKKDILPKKHIVDRYLETVELFGVTNDGKGLDYFVSKAEEKAASELVPIKENYIVLVVGGKHETKKIPEEITYKILADLTHPIVLLGGPEDVGAASGISKLLKGKVINLCGTTNLNVSATIIRKAALVITPDTGLMHIAAAYKRPIISLWGNTIPEFGMYPYLADKKSQIFEVKNLNCRPCSKIGYQQCPKKHFKCMNNQDVTSVKSKITDILKPFK